MQGRFLLLQVLFVGQSVDLWFRFFFDNLFWLLLVSSIGRNLLRGWFRDSFVRDYALCFTSVLLAAAPVASTSAALFDFLAASRSRAAIIGSLAVARRSPSSASKLGVAVVVVGLVSECDERVKSKTVWSVRGRQVSKARKMNEFNRQKTHCIRSPRLVNWFTYLSSILDGSTTTFLVAVAGFFEAAPESFLAATGVGPSSPESSRAAKKLEVCPAKEREREVSKSVLSVCQSSYGRRGQ